MTPAMGGSVLGCTLAPDRCVALLNTHCLPAPPTWFTGRRTVALYVRSMPELVGLHASSSKASLSVTFSSDVSAILEGACCRRSRSTRRSCALICNSTATPAGRLFMLLYKEHSTLVIRQHQNTTSASSNGHAVVFSPWRWRQVVPLLVAQVQQEGVAA